MRWTRATVTSLYKIRDYHPRGYTEQPLEADCERLPDNPE